MRVKIEEVALKLVNPMFHMKEESCAPAPLRKQVPRALASQCTSLFSRVVLGHEGIAEIEMETDTEQKPLEVGGGVHGGRWAEFSA